MRDEDELTPGELVVLRLLARGYLMDQIAEKLNIKNYTVRQHISHMLQKLNLPNQICLVIWAHKTGVAKLWEINFGKEVF